MPIAGPLELTRHLCSPLLRTRTESSLVRYSSLVHSCRLVLPHATVPAVLAETRSALLVRSWCLVYTSLDARHWPPRVDCLVPLYPLYWLGHLTSWHHSLAVTMCFYRISFKCYHPISGPKYKASSPSIDLVLLITKIGDDAEMSTVTSDECSDEFE